MGIGLGNGQSKLYFLPEAHTDFTLSVLGEELGFIGVSLVLFLFGMILFRLFLLSRNIWDERMRYIFLGLTLIFGTQTFINFSVSLGLLPTKGLTLPFLSYGGFISYIYVPTLWICSGYSTYEPKYFLNFNRGKTLY